jgi:hypothetical protein
MEQALRVHLGREGHIMEQRNQRPETPEPSCNVNSTFNFTVGALAIAAAIVIGYLVWHWLQ